MKWSEEEIYEGQQAARDQDGTEVTEDAAYAIMTRAVELAAARGGTMTADALRDTLRVNEPGITHAERARRTVVFEHCVASGSRVATLEAERDTLSRRLEETNRRAQENWERQEAERDSLFSDLTRLANEAAAGTFAPDLYRTNGGRGAAEAVSRALVSATSERMRLVQERDAALKRAEAAEAESATHLAWMKEDRARAENAEARVRELAIAGQELSAAVDKHVGEPQRYPCSPTCTHDDAAFPGHSERIVERSEAFNSPSRAYNDGAEAMRSACWEAVAIECDRIGLDIRVKERVKAAIERATP